MLIIPIAGTDSPETISVAAHIYVVCFKCEHNRNIDISRSTFPGKTGSRISCGIILHQIGHATLCRTYHSAPICFIRKILIISCRGSDSFVGCSTWFARLISVHDLLVYIGVTAISVHRPGATVYNCGKQPQSLGRSYCSIQRTIFLGYPQIICSFC